MDLPEIEKPRMHCAWQLPPEAIDVGQSPMDPNSGAPMARQGNGEQVGDESAPSTHRESSPEEKYPVLQSGAHSPPDSKNRGQLPKVPLAGPELKLHCG